MQKINLLDIIEQVKEPWKTLDIFTLNNTTLKMVKIDGSFQWHTHQDQDEFFLVVKGKIHIDTNTEGTIDLNEMECYLVKKGIRHRSRADEPAWALLAQPTGTRMQVDEPSK